MQDNSEGDSPYGVFCVGTTILSHKRPGCAHRRSHSRPRAATQEGLRVYMGRVYRYMAGGLAVTGLTSYVGGVSGFYLWMAQSPVLLMVVAFAPLGLVFYFSFRLHAMSALRAQNIFWLYSVIMGLSLSGLMFAYSGESLVRVFLITSVSFLALSLYGSTTKRDLAPLGAFLFMALIGLIVGMVVNLFSKAQGFSFCCLLLGLWSLQA